MMSSLDGPTLKKLFEESRGLSALLSGNVSQSTFFSGWVDAKLQSSNTALHKQLMLPLMGAL